MKFFKVFLFIQSIVEWYMAIRHVKLNQLRVAYPGTSELELAQYLTRDFLKEGWMFKTGPRASDAYKWRWFTLDDRKLMYLEDPLVSDLSLSENKYLKQNRINSLLNESFI